MDGKSFIEKVREAFPTLTGKQERQFLSLENLYSDWNEKINVVSRKDIGNLYEHPVLHSLAIARYLTVRRPEMEAMWQEGRISVLDLGTGGGFPGIPLAILFPSVSFTLCDSIGKKITVAKEISTAIGLENAETVNERAEKLPGEFDFVVSRAVASLTDFYPWVKGKFSRDILCLKGGGINEEIAALMGRFRLPKGSVRTWEVDSWLAGPYFEGKFVVDIERI